MSEDATTHDENKSVDWLPFSLREIIEIFIRMVLTLYYTGGNIDIWK